MIGFSDSILRFINNIPEINLIIGIASLILTSLTFICLVVYNRMKIAPNEINKEDRIYNALPDSYYINEETRFKLNSTYVESDSSRFYKFWNKDISGKTIIRFQEESLFKGSRAPASIAYWAESQFHEFDIEIERVINYNKEGSTLTLEIDSVDSREIEAVVNKIFENK